MKQVFFLFSIILLSIARCGIPEPTKKLFVQSVKISDQTRIDWYVYSSISNFAPDYLQVSSNDKKPFFVSFYLTGIHLKSDSLIISLWKNDYDKLDESMVPGIKIVFDTTGEPWNGAGSRMGRLRRVGVDIDAPHFIDANCPKGECYDFDTIPRYR